MVVFALVNSGKGGGYYIASTRTSMGWRGVPRDLAGEIEDARQRGEEVEEVSIGLDGDWFLRTDRRHACKTLHDQVGSISNVELFVQLAQKGGMDLANYAIQFFSFVPDPTGYVTVFHKVDGSLTQCAWHNVPPELDRLLENQAPKGVRQVTVGMNGSYVVILNTGVVWWNGVPELLNRLLEDAEKRGRRIVTVALSLISASWFFIEFADGATKFILPPDWHDSVNGYAALAARNKGPKITTSYNPRPIPSPSPSPSPHSPWPGQPGSFSPISPYGPSSGYIPFASNPCPAPVFPGAPPPMFASPPPLAFAGPPPPAFAGPPPPAFAGPPPPAFAGHLPPAFASPPHPTYNITNVYNMASQQQPQAAATSQNDDLKVQLLGGALKVAGALLVPMLTGGVGLGT
ncbi:hypothetical protein BJV78DRAFT_1281912 [Lactifluus subvellereus]|nr:hypothetical protein BJV78DRAFT_1281912 [Lactifluus subvellereus]